MSKHIDVINIEIVLSILFMIELVGSKKSKFLRNTLYTVFQIDPQVQVFVTWLNGEPGHVYTLGGSETTFHEIVTHIGAPKKPKNPRNFLENGVLFTFVANGFRGESWYYIHLLQSMAIPSHRR